MEVYEFLKEHKMLDESFDKSEIEKRFTQCMKTRDSLQMMDSFQSNAKDKEISGDILVIDMGGTNLRFTVFKDGVMGETIAMPMIGLDRDLTAEEFFSFLANEISKYDPVEIGFCFSYPCEILSNKDAIIIQFDKEIDVIGAKGKILGEEINKRLEKKRHFSILNDTVAAQLGVAADIGFILGTGFNICYTDPEKQTIIDAECGQYIYLPMGDFDEDLNRELNSPICAEKQISGAYLGKLARIAFAAYLKRELPAFDLIDISDALKGEGRLLEIFDENELDVLFEIIKYLMIRGASRAASMLKCLIKGYSKATLALEGSTIYKLPGYYEILENEIKKNVPCEIDIIDARGKIAIGSARSLI